MIHNNRAKRNMTKQLQARLSWLNADLKREQQGLVDARKWCKLLGKIFSKSTSYKAYTKGIRDTKRQLRSLKSLIYRRQKNNECFKIL